MKRLLWIVALPLAAAAALFAVANRNPVTIDLWPLSGHVDLPLFIALAAALYAGFVLGALVAWVAGSQARSRARAAARRVAALEREVAALHHRLENAAPQIRPTRQISDRAPLMADRVNS